MTRYYTYDNNFKYTGFIEDTTQPDNSTIIVPLNDTYTLYDNSNNIWIVPEVILFSLEELKIQKIKLAREYFDEQIKSVESDTADFEVSTWDTQRQEWLEYSKDNNAITPYCDALASARGITRDDLMLKIGSNVIGFATVQGYLHNTEDAINACTTEDELIAIVW